MAKILQMLQNRYILSCGVFVGLMVLFTLWAAVLDPALHRETPKNQPAAAEVEAPKPYTFASGTQKLLPDNRIVALYGTPGSSVLGSLGEQDLAAAIERAKALAASYQPHSSEPVIAGFEIIATIASASITANNDYSNELDIAKLQPWIDAAGQNNMYVILDLQPGYSDFLTQAKIYEPLLKLPHVGLALDPEWRLAPGQKHMKQVGSVEAAEINQTAAWLADLTKANNLPQKLLLIHQFKLSMIRNSASLDTSRSELAYLIQMDGLGVQSVKQDTWRNVAGQNIPNMFYGWKNFYDEDKPMLNPEQTMQITPKPFYVSYQ